MNLDDWFSDVYASDNRAAERRFLDELPGRDELTSRRSLIEESIDDYRNAKYLAPLPALVAAFEGVLMEFAGANWTDSTKVRKAAEHVKNNVKLSASRVAWASVVGFANQLFATSP